MKVVLNQFENVSFETDNKSMCHCTNNEYLRYLKGIHTNKERFINRYVNEKLKTFKKFEFEKLEPEANKVTMEFFDYLLNEYDNVEPFSITEAFTLEDREFQALVFASINITDMIHSLGVKRIKTDGINVKHRKYNHEGEFIGIEDFSNIYETHEVNGEKLGLTEPLYVIKCWCTSTNKEHWLWIDETYKDDPLNAIASTFMVHENVIPHIKALKRQGDLLLVEMKEEVKPEGKLVSLTKEQYFGLLVAQS